jgi:hypothetical protein
MREEQRKEPAIAADGLKSDNARAQKLSPEERLALARKAVQARWYRPLRQNRRTSSRKCPVTRAVS